MSSPDSRADAAVDATQSVAAGGSHAERGNQEHSPPSIVPPGPGTERLHSDARRRNWTWYLFQLLLRLLFAVWFRYRGRGYEKLEAERGALLVINHQSFVDPLLVGLPLSRPVSYLARENLFRVPVIGWILRNTYVLPINRDQAGGAAIRTMAERLEQGYLCGIFPEGTRSDDGQVGEIKPGFIALLRRVSVPVYPIGIAGAGAVFGRRHWFPRPGRVCVVFDDPIPASELAPLLERGREQELVELVRRRITDCQQEAEAWRRGKGGRVAKPSA